MWRSHTKNDLIIEVWEKLDCENIGAAEIEAIEIVLADTFGPAAVDSPMIIARLLADEGAELRHSEIMNLYVDRASMRPYDAALRNILDLGSMARAAASIQNLENLCRKFAAEQDKEGLRLVREAARQGKASAEELSKKPVADPIDRFIQLEIVNWLTIWLQTPEVFESWLEARQRSVDFIERFGQVRSS